MHAKLITKILLNKNVKTTTEQGERANKKVIALDSSHSNWIISWTNARKSIKAK